MSEPTLGPELDPKQINELISSTYLVINKLLKQIRRKLLCIQIESENLTYNLW